MGIKFTKWLNEARGKADEAINEGNFEGLVGHLNQLTAKDIKENPKSIKDLFDGITSKASQYNNKEVTIDNTRKKTVLGIINHAMQNPGAKIEPATLRNIMQKSGLAQLQEAKAKNNARSVAKPKKDAAKTQQAMPEPKPTKAKQTGLTGNELKKGTAIHSAAAAKTQTFKESKVAKKTAIKSDTATKARSSENINPKDKTAKKVNTNSKGQEKSASPAKNNPQKTPSPPKNNTPSPAANSDQVAYNSEITKAIRQNIIAKQKAITHKYLLMEAGNEEFDGKLVKDLKGAEIDKFLQSDRGWNLYKDIVKNPEFIKENNIALIEATKQINQRFSKDFSPIDWEKGEKDNIAIKKLTNKKGEEIGQISETTISPKKPIRAKLSNGQTQDITSYRNVDVPKELDGEGPLHIKLALKGADGKNIPESKAAYFSAHYDKNGKLEEISTPQPLKFTGDGPDALAYAEIDGKVYTLAVTREQYLDLRKQVNINNNRSNDLINKLEQEKVQGKNSTKEQEKQATPKKKQDVPKKQQATPQEVNKPQVGNPKAARLAAQAGAQTSNNAIFTASSARGTAQKLSGRKANSIEVPASPIRPSKPLIFKHSTYGKFAVPVYFVRDMPKKINANHLKAIDLDKNNEVRFKLSLRALGTNADNGHKIEFVYDKKGQITAINAPNGAKIQFKGKDDKAPGYVVIDKETYLLPFTRKQYHDLKHNIVKHKKSHAIEGKKQNKIISKLPEPILDKPIENSKTFGVKLNDKPINKEKDKSINTEPVELKAQNSQPTSQPKPDLEPKPLNITRTKPVLPLKNIVNNPILSPKDVKGTSVDKTTKSREYLDERERSMDRDDEANSASSISMAQSGLDPNPVDTQSSPLKNAPEGISTNKQEGSPLPNPPRAKSESLNPPELKSNEAIPPAPPIPDELNNNLHTSSALRGSKTTLNDAPTEQKPLTVGSGAKNQSQSRASAPGNKLAAATLPPEDARTLMAGGKPLNPGGVKSIQRKMIKKQPVLEKQVQDSQRTLNQAKQEQQTPQYQTRSQRFKQSNPSLGNESTIRYITPPPPEPLPPSKKPPAAQPLDSSKSQDTKPLKRTTSQSTPPPPRAKSDKPKSNGFGKIS